MAEYREGIYSPIVKDGKPMTNAEIVAELTELRAAADLLARVRDECTANDTSAFSSDPTKGYLLIRGPHSILRELAEALLRHPSGVSSA